MPGLTGQSDGERTMSVRWISAPLHQGHEFPDMPWVLVQFRVECCGTGPAIAVQQLQRTGGSIQCREY